ncbi:hypothetical protein [Desulfocastanea catecholica]
MNLSPEILLYVVCGTIFITWIGLILADGIWQRILIFSFILGLFIYSGIGASYVIMPKSYLLIYFTFLISFLLSFLIFLKLLKNFGVRLSKNLFYIVHDIDTGLFWQVVLYVYIGMHFFPLIYPEVRLSDLLSPPTPDLKTAFSLRFTENDVNIIGKIVDYLRVLLTPFFFISLFRLRDRIWTVSSIMLLLVYLQYVDNAYIGRSFVLLILLVLFISFWVWKPAIRCYLVTFVVVGLPFLLVVADLYTIIRLGGKVYTVSFYDSVVNIFENETTFPVFAGIPVFNSGRQVDIGEYLKWILTLPIPKILTGEIGGARINYEMSEIVLGLARSNYRFFVVLPGLVVESMYIFGSHFFWLHAVFIGLIAAFFVRLLERTKQTLFLFSYIIVLISYNLNRGGISSILPIMINSFLFLYFYIFIVKFKIINKVFHR